MDAYMEYLYSSIIAEPLGDRLWKDPEYRRLAAACSAAGEALEKGLSPDQSQALSRYRTAECRLTSCESRAVFLEGVALGRWLTSQTASP